jgi:hypothetical protein
MTQSEYRVALGPHSVQRLAPFAVHRWFFLAPAVNLERPRGSVPIQFTGPGTPFIMPR